MFRPGPLSMTLCTALALGACKEGAPHGDAGAGKAAPAKAPTKAEAPKPALSAAQVLERAKPMFAALPKEAVSDKNPITDAKVELGRLLYFDARLSKNHDLSCNSCHDLAAYGVDTRAPEGNRKTSQGHRKQFGERNSPTVYNAALQLAQFWDGRSPDVEDQAKGPILNPVEMACPDDKHVLAVIESIPGYVERFTAAFPGEPKPVSYDNLGKAIGAFERRLITPAPFDRFLGGDMGALSQDQLRGLQLFMDSACITCHIGPGVGGTMFQKLGSVKPYETKDVGRFAVTKNESDKGVFKVPTLRNVAKTGPYMHDGSIDELGQVVQLMAEYQTAKGKFSDDELAAVLAFLDALTGDLPKDLIAMPDTLPSGPKTPKADPS